jgi:7-carboxy-7-deazaguanine synthase
MRAVAGRPLGLNLVSQRVGVFELAAQRAVSADKVGVAKPADGTLGGKFENADALADQIQAQWPAGDSAHRFVVMTGGEPLLQVDVALIAALHARGFQIAVETNGTIAAPPGIDWICVSPKAGAPWIQREGHELKVVWPQPALDWAELEAANFVYRYLQPMDNLQRLRNTQTCIQICLERPAWRLSIQTHKITGIR